MFFWQFYSKNVSLEICVVKKQKKKPQRNCRFTDKNRPLFSGTQHGQNCHGILQDVTKYTVLWVSSLSTADNKRRPCCVYVIEETDGGGILTTGWLALCL